MSNDESRSAGNEKGKLIVISGPSGAGKTSICKAILERLPRTIWSVSVTTRQPRSGEKSGESYEFVTHEEFEAKRDAGAFLEHARYVGEFYGTPRAPVERALEDGFNVTMEIDVQGGMQVARSKPESIRIFVLPPDMDSLRSRLEGRKTEAQEQLAKRLAEADGEIATARDSGAYPFFVVNDSLESTIETVLEIIEKESAKPCSMH